MTATEYVVLVDQEDREIGLAEKLQAHQQGLLHRAFSIFIFREKTANGQGMDNLELLLQQRAANKYHSGGLWTNTCCSHPRANEDIIDAGERRLTEELGIDTALHALDYFHYTAHFDNGLSENEIDHVLIGFIDRDTIIQPNPDEVGDYRWITLADLDKEIQAHPENFTPWLAKALNVINVQIR